MVIGHNLIIPIETEYESIVHRSSMLRGLDVFPTLCYNDTQGRGRVVLKQAPQVVVMMMVKCLIGGVRSAIEPTQLLSGLYVVRSMKPESTYIIAEEKWGRCRHRLGWEDMLVSIVDGWVFLDLR